MENEYNIFDDLKGQIESKLDYATKEEAFWRNRALENRREKDELKKKLEEVEKALGKED